MLLLPPVNKESGTDRPVSLTTGQSDTATEQWNQRLLPSKYIYDKEIKQRWLLSWLYRSHPIIMTAVQTLPPASRCLFSSHQSFLILEDQLLFNHPNVNLSWKMTQIPFAWVYSQNTRLLGSPQYQSTMETPILQDEPVSASESENEEETVPSTAQSARQEQNVFFKNLWALALLPMICTWTISLTFSNRLAQAAKDLTKQELNRPSTVENAGSTRYLLTTQDFAATIDDPRDYQIELYERAKKENTIAVLATGTECSDPWCDGWMICWLYSRIWQNPNSHTSPETYHSKWVDQSRTGSAASYIFLPGMRPWSTMKDGLRW